MVRVQFCHWKGASFSPCLLKFAEGYRSFTGAVARNSCSVFFIFRGPLAPKEAPIDQLLFVLFVKPLRRGLLGTPEATGERYSEGIRCGLCSRRGIFPDTFSALFSSVATGLGWGAGNPSGPF